MSRRLLYVVGPSGAGKDSLLGWLRARLPADAPVRFARRSIDRPAQAGGEDHEPLETAAFVLARAAGAFALHWAANGRLYGVRHAELAPLDDEGWVVVNGSREHLPVARRRHPGLTLVHVTASADVLRARLIARGREGAATVEARVRRATAFGAQPVAAQVEVRNDGTLAAAGAQLLAALAALPGWPVPVECPRADAAASSPAIGPAIGQGLGPALSPTGRPARG